ncbi:hypothetical protein V1477_009441 [Vespula maculifrons]|uniref:Uncharacterized protein n=1 Tax=Vespula maculifrons TaxID=7453 RepID=A0ABD2C9X2_VESMC
MVGHVVKDKERKREEKETRGDGRSATNVSEVFRGEFSKRVVADDDGVGNAAAPAVGDGGSSDIDEERCWDSVCVADSPNTPYYFHLS